MRVFLISMADYPDRRRSAIEKLNQLQIPFEIVDGVEAKRWRPEELPFTDHARTWMVPGEAGCYMAHLRTMQRILAYDLQYACVLEDDFCVESDVDFDLAELETLLPQPFDYIQLQKDWGWNKELKVVYRDGYFERTRGTSLGTVAYVIHQNLCDEILRHHCRCDMPIDHLLSKLSSDRQFYRPIKPLFGIQEGLSSSIHS